MLSFIVQQEGKPLQSEEVSYVMHNCSPYLLAVDKLLFHLLFQTYAMYLYTTPSCFCFFYHTQKAVKFNVIFYSLNSVKIHEANVKNSLS